MVNKMSFFCPGSTSAILYPASRLPRFLSRLESAASGHPDLPVDLLIRDLLGNATTEMTGWLAAGTDFFRHVGYTSSLHSHRRRPHYFYIPELGLIGE